MRAGSVYTVETTYDDDAFIAVIWQRLAFGVEGRQIDKSSM
jgi:hypothetical protein